MSKFDDLVGIPYKAHGRDENGIDCFGLIWLIHKRIGKPIPDVWYKGFDLELISMADQMGLKKCELKEGCIVATEKDGRLHLGYAIDTERMIHTTINDGTVVEPISSYKVKGFYGYS